MFPQISLEPLVPLNLRFSQLLFFCIKTVSLIIWNLCKPTLNVTVHFLHDNFNNSWFKSHTWMLHRFALFYQFYVFNCWIQLVSEDQKIRFQKCEKKILYSFLFEVLILGNFLANFSELQNHFFGRLTWAEWRKHHGMCTSEICTLKNL